MKKIYFIFVGLAMMFFIPGCGETYHDAEMQITVEESTEASLPQEEAEAESGENPKTDWELAYIEAINHIYDFLADPYNIRAEIGGPRDDDWYYIGMHDFDGDGVPELILGDGISVGVITYSMGKVEKVMDVYEPESWGGFVSINFGHDAFRLTSCGSDGCGYVNFGFRDGEYKIAVYDEYAPDEITVNGEEASFEDFNRIFRLEGENGKQIDRLHMRKEGDIRIVTIKNEDMTVDESFDLDKIRWDNARVDAQALSVQDFGVIGHPVLENNYYECVDIDEIKKNENEMLQYTSEENSNGYFTYYKGDGIIYTTHSGNESKLAGITLIDGKYAFSGGLHVGMAKGELFDMGLEVQTSPGLDDPDISQIVLQSMKEGPLAEIEYDEIYRITGAVDQRELDDIGIFSALAKGFVVFVKEGIIAAVSTDLPTAG